MELQRLVIAHVLGNVVTTLFLGVLVLNYILWEEYVVTLLWAFILSQALHSPKAKLTRAIKMLSQEDARPMVFVLWDMMAGPFQRMHADGRPVYEMVFVWALDWCIESFALVGLISCTSRVSVGLLVATSLVALLCYGLLYVLDRRVFAYRRVVSDNTVACTLLITTFFASISLIVLFLGLESVLEGLNAGKDVSSWIQTMLDDESNSESEWGKNIVRVTEFAQETASGLASKYNETAWYPVAQNAISNYFEHGALTAPTETCADEPTGGAVSGLLGAIGGVSGVIEHVSSLNISMEHVVDYGEPGGKIFASGATLLASFGSFLIMVGFKVVLLFTCVFYMTSHDDFLERNIGDFLPLSQADQKRAMKKLRGAIHGVFFMPCKVACLHGVVTLLSFKVLQIEFPFFAAFVAVLVSILPIVPAFIVCWPWALMLVLHGRWVGIILAISQHLILSVIDTELYTQQGVREANPYLTSLSCFLGYSVFGAHGVLMGPLVLCLGTLIYSGLGFVQTSMAQGTTYDQFTSARKGAHVDAPRTPRSDRPQPRPRGMVSTLLEEEGSAGSTNVSRDTRVTNHHEGLGEKETSDIHEVISSLQLAELWSSFTRNLHESEGVPSSSCSRRVTLQLARRPASIGGELQEHTADHEESAQQTWRFRLSPSLTWEAFLLEVQGVMGVPEISGVYGSDGARIKRVDFIEHGEILDVVANNPTGSG
ncbi:unnamed protein product [Ectocarpus sp. 13 AM-2016]